MYLHFGNFLVFFLFNFTLYLFVMFNNENNITTTSAEEFLWIAIDLPYNVIVHREVKLIFVSIFLPSKDRFPVTNFTSQLRMQWDHLIFDYLITSRFA